MGVSDEQKDHTEGVQRKLVEDCNGHQPHAPPAAELVFRLFRCVISSKVKLLWNSFFTQHGFMKIEHESTHLHFAPVLDVIKHCAYVHLPML